LPGQFPMINDYAQMLSQANALRADLEEQLANARESVRKKDERIDKLDKIVQAQTQNLDEEKEIANRRLIDYSVKIAELEVQRDELKSLLKKNLSTFINKKEEDILLGIPMFEAYQLEQQANGVEDAANDYSDNLDATMVYLADLDDRVIDLRNQAKALKDQT
jgi:chromosome segregation ATPase